MRIRDLGPDDAVAVHQAAALLVAGFKEHWPEAWPDMDSALAELQDMLQPDKIVLIALSDDERIIGLAGGQDVGYDHSRVWELHPLVVHPDFQGQGIGRTLVQELEQRVRQRGAITLMLGSDDMDSMTSLADCDLYDRTWERIQQIQNFKGHPYSFYENLGYHIIGVVPDANGPGKPDILLAKRL